MGKADYYKAGSWNALCSMCGFKFKADELTKNWQGMYRCSKCQESRQPQDFVRAVPDIQTPPWTQAPGVDTFLTVCTPQGISAIPGEAQPGCAIPGYISPSYIDDYFTP